MPHAIPPRAPGTPAEPADDDAELAQRAASGDERAFETLMRRHNRLLFRTARSILRVDAEAEDAVQEAYLRAWRALAAFRAESKLSTWLVRIVINESLARLRRSRVRVVSVDVRADDDTPAAERQPDDPDHRPDRMAARAEVRRLMEARIDHLPDTFRTVFVLRAVEELSVEETAAMLGIPEATVRTRYFRARGLLREAMLSEIDAAAGDAFSFDGERCNRMVATVLARWAAGRGPRP